ncbi:hypothetical protein DY000_02000535 [Brassica cretica]|uniref:RING-type E3 ubiquitin transferase n=1 Tax=Brassica cretica TaxID=69181 RepID=A0ABQ7CBJ7_BRACR|nr:hypothetical protein DY000_02000535 [Brassica cretica]
MWDAVVSGGGGGGGGRGCKHRVAVKKVSLREDMDVDGMQGELESLRKASMWCRNVCTFHGVVKMEGSLYLLMDRCFGSVQSEMQRNEGRLTLEQILRYGADVSRGVAELHAAGVICMNIKPSNLLLDASGNALISDYGLAPILKKPTTRPEFDSPKVAPCTDYITYSPHYTAPEAWGPVKKLFWEDASGVSPESDAWSFGCTLVEMCTGSIPWDGLSREEIFQAVVKDRKVPPQYERIVGVGIPREVWKMIGECLQFKPSKRPTFNAMLATFLRHLQEIPRSPSASPHNGFTKICGVNVVVEETRPTNIGVLDDSPGNLHRVVLEGDSEGVRNILAKAAAGSGGSSVRFLLEEQNADGQSALHLACRRGSVELVEAILEYEEANVDIVDKVGDPPLVFALQAGSPQCVHFLIKRGVNVRSRLRDGSGPSVAHACSGQPDCMRELLVAGADPNAVDDEGETVLHRAVAKKYRDCAIVILENGGSRSMAVTNEKHLTPLHMCVATWNVAVIKRWVEVSSPEQISEAINIQSPGGTALCMAAAIRKDHEKEGREIVQILLAAGADPSAQDAMHGRTALHTAAMSNNVELVRVILDAGVNANIQNMNKTIPLHLALAGGANACVSLLLESGSDCNIQDNDRDNAFHIAADAAKKIRENLECYKIGDWVKFKRDVTTPLHGWQGANPKSVGFVQNILAENEDMIVAFCSGEARLLANEVVKLIPLDKGQHVRLRKDVKEPRFGWRGQSHDSVGSVLCVDDDGTLRVGFPGASRGWKADPAEMERVEEFKVGDWVRIPSAKHGFGSVVPGSMGIVYSVRGDKSLLVDLCYLPNHWPCEPEEVEPVDDPFRLGLCGSYRCGTRALNPMTNPDQHYSSGNILAKAATGSGGSSVRYLLEAQNADGQSALHLACRRGSVELVEAILEYGEANVDIVDKDGDPPLVFALAAGSPQCVHVLIKKGANVRSRLREGSGPSVAHVCSYHGQPDCMRELLVAGADPNAVDDEGETVLHRAVTKKYTDCAIVILENGGSRSMAVSNGKGLTPLHMCVSTWNVAVIKRWVEVSSPEEISHAINIPSPVGTALCMAAAIRKDHEKGDNAFHIAADAAKMIRENLDWLIVMLKRPDAAVDFPVYDHNLYNLLNSGKTVRDFLEALPREWISEDLMEALLKRGVHLSPTIYEIGDWVKFKRGITTPLHGWQGAKPKSVGFVQTILEKEDMIVAFCSGEARVLASEVVKLIPLDRGQHVRLRKDVKEPRFGWRGQSRDSVGTVLCVDEDGILRVGFPGASRGWKADPAEMERVEEFKVGDWVRIRQNLTSAKHGFGSVVPGSMGIVYCVRPDSSLLVELSYLPNPWHCEPEEVEPATPFRIGDRVCVKRSVAEPRYAWGGETHHSVGKISEIENDGLLIIEIPNRPIPWQADPSDMEKIDDFKVKLVFSCSISGALIPFNTEPFVLRAGW